MNFDCVPYGKFQIVPGGPWYCKWEGWSFDPVVDFDTWQVACLVRNGPESCTYQAWYDSTMLGMYGQINTEATQWDMANNWNAGALNVWRAFGIDGYIEHNQGGALASPRGAIYHMGLGYWVIVRYGWRVPNTERWNTVIEQNPGPWYYAPGYSHLNGQVYPETPANSEYLTPGGIPLPQFDTQTNSSVTTVLNGPRTWITNNDPMPSTNQYFQPAVDTAAVETPGPVTVGNPSGKSPDKWNMMRFASAMYLLVPNKAYRDVLTAQAILETGGFTSDGFNLRNSPFGMRPSTQRQKFYCSTRNGFAVYCSYWNAIRDRLDLDVYNGITPPVMSDSEVLAETGDNTGTPQNYISRVVMAGYVPSGDGTSYWNLWNSLLGQPRPAMAAGLKGAAVAMGFAIALAWYLEYKKGTQRATSPRRTWRPKRRGKVG